MKTMYTRAASLTAIFFAAAALTGCAGFHDKHGEHHRQGASETMSRPGPGGQMGMMDMKSMCEMHERMQGAKTPQERSAIMEERMKNMTPEMRQRHMQMMQQCR